MKPDAQSHMSADALPGFTSFAGRSMLYSLGSITQKVVGVLLIPALARVLTPAQFGRVEVLSTLATTMASILILGLDIVFTRRWADLGDAGRRTMIGTWLAIALASGGTVAALMAIFAGPLSALLLGTDSFALAVRFVALFTLVDLLYVACLTTLRNQDRPWLYGAISAGAALANGVLVGSLVVVYRSEAAVMLGIAAAIVVGTIPALLAVRASSARPRLAEARVLLLTAVPLVPALLLTWGGDLLNRVVLLNAAGAVEVGYLSIALRFGTIGLLFVTGFQLAWHPRAYDISRRSGGLARVARDGTLIMVSLCIVTATVAAAGPELLRILAGDRYAGALPAVGVALLMPAAMGSLMLATLPAALANRMRAFGAATAISAAVVIALTVLLSPPFGARGAAWAQVGGPLAGAAYALIRARQHGVWVPYRWTTPGLSVLGAAVVALVATTEPAASDPLLRALLLAGFLAMVWALEAPLGVGLLRQIGRRRRS